MKNNSLNSLPSFNNQGKSILSSDLKSKKVVNTNKNYGAQARLAAMQSIQRASGRRGN